MCSHTILVKRSEASISAAARLTAFSLLSGLVIASGEVTRNILTIAPHLLVHASVTKNSQNSCLWLLKMHFLWTTCTCTILHEWERCISRKKKNVPFEVCTPYYELRRAWAHSSKVVITIQRPDDAAVIIKQLSTPVRSVIGPIHLCRHIYTLFFGCSGQQNDRIRAFNIIRKDRKLCTTFIVLYYIVLMTHVFRRVGNIALRCMIIWAYSTCEFCRWSGLKFSCTGYNESQWTQSFSSWKLGLLMKDAGLVIKWVCECLLVS